MMNLILGMGFGVFLAWILTILSAIFCVVYGIYNEYINKTSKNAEKKLKDKE